MSKTPTMTKTETVNDKSPTVETMSTIVQAALEHNEGKANLATIAKLATRTAGYKLSGDARAKFENETTLAVAKRLGLIG